ncbi:MAG: DUF3108 domain-containing protein [Vicinamibacterales bacterium]
MTRLKAARALCVLTVLTGSGAAWTAAQSARPSGPARPRADAAVPFAIGETLRYDVSWSSYLTAGTATVSVRERTTAAPGPAYHIVAEGQPIGLLSSIYPVYYKAETWLDAASLLPHRGSIYSQEGRRAWTKTTRFDRAAGTATFEVTGSLSDKRTLKVPRMVHDALSAFFAVRNMALKDGTRMMIPVSDDGESFSVEVLVNGREPLRSGIGTVNTWRLTPTILDGNGRPVTDQRLALWVTDDARRVPVKLESDLGFGTFVLLLRELQR